MTKSTITREQLIKKAQEQIEFCRHTKITGEGRAHVNQCAALFEIALAAMDSEPVAYAVSNDFWNQGNHKQHIDGKECDLFFSGDVYRGEKIRPDNYDYVFPLYRHAQQSVVPEEMTIMDACKFVQDMRLFDDVSVIVMRTWNACRATMLQASPVCTCPSGDGSLRWPCPVHAGNSLVIPDGSASMLRRWLAFGRGMQNAGCQLPHNLIAETEAMLAAAQQEVKSES